MAVIVESFRDRVRVEIDGGIADVVLARPDKRNALDGAMFAAVAEAGEWLKRRPEVRVAVLSGEGASFCAGLDFASIGALAGAGGDANPGSAGSDDDIGSALGTLTASGITHFAQQVCWVWQELPVPVIAALHGHALGGGLQIALGADVRIAHPDTKLSIREVHWGLVPDMTATLTLSRLVRPDVAKELVFTARLFDAREGAQLGVVTRLSEQPRDDALALAAEIAARSPHAVRGVKQLFNLQANAGAAEQFAAERQAIGSLVGTPNQVEAVIAGFENRPPVFADPV